MTTIANLIDYTFRTFLEPPDHQPIRASARGTGDGGDITINNTQIIISDFEVPEDERLMRTGVIIEAGQEAMRVASWSDLTGVATVERAFLGTPSSAYAGGATVKLAPAFPRYSVFEAVRNNIISLYPKLYTTTVEYLTGVDRNVYPITDPLVAEVIEMTPQSRIRWRPNIHGKIVDFALAANGRAFVTDAQVHQQLLIARLRRRFGVATSESTTYEDLGLEQVWEPVVAAGAAADLMVGRDLPASHTDWVGSVLETEGIEVGSRQSLAVGLARYRELLIDRYASEMDGESGNAVAVEMQNPFTQVV